MNMFSKTIILPIILLLAVMGCGGESLPNHPNTPNTLFTLGGTVSGLLGSGLLLEARAMNAVRHFILRGASSVKFVTGLVRRNVL